MVTRLWLIGFLFLSISGFLPVNFSQNQVSTAQVFVLDRDEQVTTEIFDGSTVHARIELPENVNQPSEVQFSLDEPEIEVARCTIPAGEQACTSQPFQALGWYWGVEPAAADNRTLLAQIDDQAVGQSAALRVSPRPVVLVHGFISNWQTWNSYLRPQGFLAALGLQGFAVGDGSAEGLLNTGAISEPARRTNTLFENAVVLDEYIQDVKRKTGAEMVDLVGHSMGGMISRVYIDRLMGAGLERDVAQLIMLGTPNLGSDCAVLPAALGWYLPASLEIRSSYARQVLNPQVFQRKGVSFFELAGDPILQPVGSPCTAVPSDSVVSLESVSAIPVEVSRLALLHSSMTSSEEAFESFVRPLLQKGPQDFAIVPDPGASSPDAGSPEQFSNVYTGHLNPGETREIMIQIEPGVRVANFALHDPSASLTTDVFGASGSQIQLDTQTNGLLVIDDPDTLVHLGYGFENPKPGIWRVVLKTGDKTPSQGADYALMAKFEGGVLLKAEIDRTLPQAGESVRISARLSFAGAPLQIESAQAALRVPGESVQEFPLLSAGDEFAADWAPDAPGLYGIDLLVKAKLPDGTPVERSAFLSVEAQPEAGAAGRSSRLLVPLCGALLVGLVGIGLIVMGLRSRRR